jgi:hypothetical protein
MATTWNEPDRNGADLRPWFECHDRHEIFSQSEEFARADFQEFADRPMDSHMRPSGSPLRILLGAIQGTYRRSIQNVTVYSKTRSMAGTIPCLLRGVPRN